MCARDLFWTDLGLVVMQIFALLDVGEQVFRETPAILDRLPAQLLSMRKKLLCDFVVEARATFNAFCTSLSQDLHRYSGPPNPLSLEIPDSIYAGTNACYCLNA